MADNRPQTTEQAQREIVTKLQENGRKLREAYSKNDKAAIERYSKEYDRLTAQLRASGTIGNIGAGLASTAVGLLTGLPDLAISGYNFLAQPQTPVRTLRERVLEAAQIPTEAVAQENQLAYAAPDIATGVVGLAQLTSLGASGIRSWLNNRKTKELLNKLPESEQNFFSNLMLRGQGSPNAEVAAQIARLERDPKYSEILNALKREASTRSTAGMAPAASRITEEQAAVGAASSVQNRIEGLAEARRVAGDNSFTKAFGYGEGRQLVDPKNTIAEIDKLIARYSGQMTDSSKKAEQVLTAFRDRLSEVSAPASPFAAVGGGAQPSRLKTPEQVQSILTEFGKKASQGDSLIKDLAISDERVISAAIFGGMKDDLAAAFKGASGADRTALGMLIKARKEIAEASTKYSDAIAQGLPAFLKDKRISEINFEDLYSQYKNATPTQRATFRSYVQNTDPESLKSIDSRVWSDFSQKYTGTLPDGLPGIDLAKMAQDWNKMSAVEKDAVATALGQKTSDFSQRMKDALVFTRKVSTGQPEGTDIAGVTREAAAVVGSTPAGYQGAKITQLIGDAFGAFRKGVVSNELALKTLLTPEGAEFLKTAKLSPGSQKTLEALTKTANTSPALPAWMAVGTAAAPTMQGGPEFVVPEEFNVPEGMTPAAPAEQPAQEEMGFVVPDEFKQTQQAPASTAPVSSRGQMQRDILNAELTKAQQALTTVTDPAQRQRLELDIQSLNRELSRVR